MADQRARRPSPYAEVEPALGDYTHQVLFGDLWERSALSKRDGSLATVAALIAGYRVNEWPFHLGFALENGVTKDELVEAITHLAFYAGWPAADSAVTLSRKVFEEAGI